MSDIAAYSLWFVAFPPLFVASLRSRSSGHGTYYLNNGDRYEGQFVKGRMHGLGVYTHASGSVRRGRFANGAYVGEQ